MRSATLVVYSLPVSAFAGALIGTATEIRVSRSCPVTARVIRPMDNLLNILKARLQVAPTTDSQCSPPIVPRPPVSKSEFAEFERESGLELPDTMRRIYTEIANGGFGPSWGLNPLTHETQISIHGWDRYERSHWENGVPPTAWPDPLIRLCEIGCNAYFGVHLNGTDFPVYIVDPQNGGDTEVDWLEPQNVDFATWINEWATKPAPELLT